MPLPPGPSDSVLAQTVRMHRDPLGTLRAARERFGPAFTVRLLTARPLVVVADVAAVAAIAGADPGRARAGEARRRILPMASPRSAFGGDGAAWASARAPLEAALAPDAIAARRDALAQVARRHVAEWPRGRPFRLLPRIRALIDDAFVRVLLGVRDEARAAALARAIGRMLWTPGNPPVTIPGAGDGLVGALGQAAFERRKAPVAALLVEELEARRRGDGGPPGDVLDALLAANPARPAADLADELLPLLMAAQEPPSAALTWLLERLARHPGLAPDAGVIRETLRLRPPAVGVLRRFVEPVELAGHHLPAGVTVMLPIPLIHYDPREYPDPDRFDPARPASERAYLPFGGGARQCVGQHLARAYLDAMVPEVPPLRAVWPHPERMVLRATILVPHRSALVALR